MTTDTRRQLVLGFASSLLASLVFALLPVARPDSGTMTRLLLHPIPVVSLLLFGALQLPAMVLLRRWQSRSHQDEMERLLTSAEEDLSALTARCARLEKEVTANRTLFAPQLGMARRIAFAIAEGAPYSSLTRETVVSRVLGAKGNTATEVEILDVFASLLAHEVIHVDTMSVGLRSEWRSRLSLLGVEAKA